MKVLAISSSPRLHGNSDLLCDQFLKGAAEAREKDIIYGSGAWDKGDILRRPAYEKAFELGKALL